MCGTNNQAVSIGQGRQSGQWMRKSGQWMRKGDSMDEKKWATDQTTAAFVSIEVQPGLRYMQASLVEGGGVWNNAVKPTLSRWQNLPGSTGDRTCSILPNSSLTPLLNLRVSNRVPGRKLSKCEQKSLHCMYVYVWLYWPNHKNFPMEASVIIYDYNHCRLSIIHRLHSFKTPATVIIIVLRGGWVMSLLGRKTKALVVWTNHWF